MIKFLNKEDIFISASLALIYMQKYMVIEINQKSFMLKNQEVGKIKEYRLLQLETININCFILFISKAQPIKKSANINLIYLSTYSPDLNPIEKNGGR